MKNKPGVATVLVLIALALLAAGCGSSGSGGSSSDFRLGLEAPLSGEQAVLGEGYAEGRGNGGGQAQRQGRDRGQAGRSRADRRRRRSGDRGQGGEGGDRRRARRDRRPLQLRRRRRNPAALHKGGPRAHPPDLRPVDQRARLHPAADDLPDRSGGLEGADRLARREEGRDRLRPDAELHRLGLQGAEGIA